MTRDFPRRLSAALFLGVVVASACGGGETTRTQTAGTQATATAVASDTSTTTTTDTTTATTTDTGTNSQTATSTGTGTNEGPLKRDTKFVTTCASDTVSGLFLKTSFAAKLNASPTFEKAYFSNVGCTVQLATVVLSTSAVDNGSNLVFTVTDASLVLTSAPQDANSTALCGITDWSLGTEQTRTILGKTCNFMGVKVAAKDGDKFTVPYALSGTTLTFADSVAPAPAYALFAGTYNPE